MLTTSDDSSLVRTLLYVVGICFDGVLCTEEYGYQNDDIVMLTDDQSNPRSIPTRMNMVSRRAHFNVCMYAHNSQLPLDSCFPMACAGRTAQ